jgi:hypothetical protein
MAPKQTKDFAALVPFSGDTVMIRFKNINKLIV